MLLSLNQLPDQFSYQQRVQMAKPTMAQDTCFAEDGSIIASGKGVFNGNWNQYPDGTCTKLLPIYSNSRIKAGAPGKAAFLSVIPFLSKPPSRKACMAILTCRPK